MDADLAIGWPVKHDRRIATALLLSHEVLHWL